MIPGLRPFFSSFFACASHCLSSSRKERWRCGSLLLRAISAHSRASCRSRSVREFIYRSPASLGRNFGTKQLGIELIQINLHASAELLRDAIANSVLGQKRTWRRPLCAKSGHLAVFERPLYPRSTRVEALREPMYLPPLPQYPAPQRYCHATPKTLNSLPVRVVMPVLALNLIEL